MGAGWVVLAGVAILGGVGLAMRSFGFHAHRWRIEGVLALGDAVEVCHKCGMRRVWVARRGQEVKVEMMTKEEWETGAEVQTKLVRVRSTLESDKPRKPSS